MKFVIPSYNRYDKLNSLSLKYLKSQNINASDIYIFVRVDDDDLVNYHKLKDDGYNIITTVGCKGIGKTHNYITEYFEENEFIIELDDDLIDIVDKDKKPIESLDNELNKMIEIMKKDNINYGGFYQVDNKLFMSRRDNYETDLRYLLGIFRIRRICKDIILETNFSEDFENCLLHYIRDGKILKNNWLCAKTKNYAKGGCNADGRDTETERKDKTFLSEKYPKYTRLFQRKSGIWDLRIKHYV